MSITKRREIDRLMKDAGFVEERTVRHGRFFADGVTRLLAPRQSDSSDRNYRNLIADIRRAVRKREEMHDRNREPRRTIVATTPKQAEELKAQLGEIVSIKTPKEPVKLAPKQDPKVDLKKRMAGRSKEEQERLELRLLELIEAGHKHKHVAEIMNMEGWRTLDGTPISVSFVGTWCARLGFTRKKKKPMNTEKPKQAPPKIVPEVVSAPPVAAPSSTSPLIAILKDANLTDAKKVRMLLAYLED